VHSSTELQSKIDAGLSSFVAAHVQRVFHDKLPSGVRDRMPARYLVLEQDRLTVLISRWLEYESTRVAFHVEGTEVPTAVTIAGLELNLRLDRIDRLPDNTLLVIDYKTGDVNPKSWNPPRPEDVQLPLYATFAPGLKDQLGGLVFAKIRPEKQEFAGCVADAKSTLLPKLRGNTNLVKRPLTPDQLLGWRDEIEQLAADFLSGRADVDPRAFPDTCKNCGLQSLCRVLDTRQSIEDDSVAEGAGDE
jgi:RecB family exonuclease